MAGIFGEVSWEDCVEDVFWGTFYLQHRAQDYCGLACSDDGKLRNRTHRGLVREQFSEERLSELRGKKGIGSVSSERQPIGEFGKSGKMVVTFDGNIVNNRELVEEAVREGATFSEFGGEPGEVNDNALVTHLITKSSTFEKGIEMLLEKIKGDFSVIALTPEGIYGARGWGRKPLILGRKNGTCAISSESCAFENLGIEIVRDVFPGEVVFLDESGIHSIKKFDLGQVKYGTFEWVYTAFPSSVIDGRVVAEVRRNLGKLLARRYPVEADYVSPTPDSGRWSAIGYSEESKIPYIEVFSKYAYAGRSFTPKRQEHRDKEAKTKLIPNRFFIKDKKIVITDDSIVRGTQMKNRLYILQECGAKEVHVRVSCMPLKSACQYGKTIRQDEECIARRMSVDEIREKIHATSLGYATIEDLETAIGFSREKLCLNC